MRYRINQIKLNFDESEDRIPKRILDRLKNNSIEIDQWDIRRKSIDARHKDDIKYVYTVDFSVVDRKSGQPLLLKVGKGSEKGTAFVRCKKNEIAEVDEKQFEIPLLTGNKPENPPVIAGFGPCGIFAALVLAKAGMNPVVVERGKDVDRRTEDVNRFWNGGELNTQSNVQFGEGGAGTFSDGKLTTGINNPSMSYVLREFVKAGAPEDILYLKKAHIGTDILKDVVKNIRQQIIELGGRILFSTKLTGIQRQGQDGRISAVEITDIEENGMISDRVHTIATENLILAIGHSARDTFRYLNEVGVSMEQKPFSMGVRIQHHQKMINRAQYGKDNLDYKMKYLPPADYKLSHHCENGRGVYTFCMCPGGYVIKAASESETAVTNGMSYHARDGKYANSGLLVDVRTEDFPGDDALAGVRLQEEYEHLSYINGGRTGIGPMATWKQVRDDEKKAQPLKKSLPDFVVESIKEAMPYLGNRLTGFDSDDALLLAVESRSSSPVRFPRNENQESNVLGLYPAGEGTGHAGGIVSAACDGIRIAETIIKMYNK